MDAAYGVAVRFQHRENPSLIRFYLQPLEILGNCVLVERGLPDQSKCRIAVISTLESFLSCFIGQLTDISGFYPLRDSLRSGVTSGIQTAYPHDLCNQFTLVSRTGFGVQAGKLCPDGANADAELLGDLFG